MNSYASGNADPLVVRSEDLADLILPIIQRVDGEREREKSTADKHGNHGPMSTWQADNHTQMSDSNYRTMITGKQFVATAVGVTPEVVQRTLFQYEWVGFGKADQWLTALGLPHMVKKLRPVPNPLWGSERWEEWSQSNRHCTSY